MLALTWRRAPLIVAVVWGAAILCALRWVPGNLVYLAILSKIFFDWLNEREADEVKRDAGLDRDAL